MPRLKSYYYMYFTGVSLESYKKFMKSTEELQCQPSYYVRGDLVTGIGHFGEFEDGGVVENTNSNNATEQILGYIRRNSMTWQRQSVLGGLEDRKAKNKCRVLIAGKQSNYGQVLIVYTIKE